MEKDSQTPEAEDLPIIACWDKRCLHGQLLAEEAPQAVGRYVDLLFGADELLRDPPDLLRPVHVQLDPSTGAPENQRLRFGGFVQTAEPREDGAWLLRAFDMAPWAEGKSGGIGVRNGTDLREVFWAMAREQGTPPERISIPGWRPPRERFLVVIPVEGVEPQGELDTGSFGMTHDPAAPKRWMGLGPDDLQAAFIEPRFWGVTWIEANTLWDAEQAAVRLFEGLLGRVMLAGRYSLAAVPGDALRPFRRSRQLADVRLRPIAGVEGLRTHRMWLRGYSRSRVDSQLDNESIGGMEDFIGTSSRATDEAVTAWRRGSTVRDLSAAVVAIGEALEFYVSEAKVPPRLFSPEEKKAIRRAAREALAHLQASRGEEDPKAAEKAQRLDNVLGGAYAPPFTLRLRTALEEDGVPRDDLEFDVLVRFRELRDKIVHGQERALPNEEELHQVLALVNRALVFRLFRLRRNEQPSEP